MRTCPRQQPTHLHRRRCPAALDAAIRQPIARDALTAQPPPDAPAEPHHLTTSQLTPREPSAVSQPTTTYFAISRSAAGHSARNRIADRSADAAKASLQLRQATLAAATSRHTVSVYMQFGRHFAEAEQ